jgi:hypothetical protein
MRRRGFDPVRPTPSGGHGGLVLAFVAVLGAVLLTSCGEDTAACPTAEDGVVLDDPAAGVWLVLPPGWHRMLPGDAAWQQIYGNDRTYERQLEDGTMQDYALALGTPDVRLISLAIYVQPTRTGTTPEDAGSRYAATIGRFVDGQYGPGREISTAAVDVPAGHAARVEGVLPLVDPRPDASPGAHDHRILAYVFVEDSTATYLVLRGQAATFAPHAAEMSCMAASLRLEAPAPRASADASG